MVITFKFCLTLSAIIWNLEILHKNSTTPFDPNVDYVDCTQFTTLERVYLGVQITQVVLRCVDIFAIFAVVMFYNKSKEEAGKAEESAYNTSNSIKFGEEDGS